MARQDRINAEGTRYIQEEEDWNNYKLDESFNCCILLNGMAPMIHKEKRNV